MTTKYGNCKDCAAWEVDPKSDRVKINRCVRHPEQVMTSHCHGCFDFIPKEAGSWIPPIAPAANAGRPAMTDELKAAVERARKAAAYIDENGENPLFFSRSKFIRALADEPVVMKHMIKQTDEFGLHHSDLSLMVRALAEIVK